MSSARASLRSPISRGISGKSCMVAVFSLFAALMFATTAHAERYIAYCDSGPFWSGDFEIDVPHIDPNHPGSFESGDIKIKFVEFLLAKYGVDVSTSDVFCGAYSSPSEERSFKSRQMRFLRENNDRVVETGWIPATTIGTIKTATGQGPSRAWALQLARKSAMTTDGAAIRRWDEFSCTEGTKLKSQYGKATVPNWSCSQPFAVAETRGDIAKAASGQGATEEVAIAVAKKSAGRYGETITTWGVPVCSQETKVGNQYTRETAKYVNCSLDYTTTP